MKRITFNLKFTDLLMQSFIAWRGLLLWVPVTGIILRLPILINKLVFWEFLNSQFPPQLAYTIYTNLFTVSGMLIGFGIGGWLGLLLRLSILYLKNKSEFHNMYIELAEAGAEYGCSQFKIHFDWTQVKKLSKHPNAFMIKAKHPMAFAFMLVPTHAFEDAEQADNFYRQACEYWAKHKGS